MATGSRGAPLSFSKKNLHPGKVRVQVRSKRGAIISSSLAIQLNYWPEPYPFNRTLAQGKKVRPPVVQPWERAPGLDRKTPHLKDRTDANCRSLLASDQRARRVHPTLESLASKLVSYTQPSRSKLRVIGPIANEFLWLSVIRNPWVERHDPRCLRILALKPVAVCDSGAAGQRVGVNPIHHLLHYFW